jgi:hypothetical protein
VADIEWWLKLGNQSWPLVTLIGLAWIAVRLSRWGKPHIEKLAGTGISFLEEGIRTNTANAKAIGEQTKVLSSLDARVESIQVEQDDPAGHLSNVLTLAKLDRSLLNDQTIARAGIDAMESLVGHYPELAGRFDQAIELLKQVEKS